MDLHGTGRDVRHGFRIVRRRPGFAAAVIITLALGIGASTSIFSVVDGVIFRPLAYAQPDQLVTVWETYPMWRGRPVLDAHWDRIGLAWPDYVTWRDAQRTFAGVAVYAEGQVTLLNAGEAERLDAVAVSASMLDVLGAAPSLGRGDAGSSELSSTFQHGAANSPPAPGPLRGPVPPPRRTGLANRWRSREVPFKPFGRSVFNRC